MVLATQNCLFSAEQAIVTKVKKDGWYVGIGIVTMINHFFVKKMTHLLLVEITILKKTGFYIFFTEKKPVFFLTLSERSYTIYISLKIFEKSY